MQSSTSQPLAAATSQTPGKPAPVSRSGRSSPAEMLVLLSMAVIAAAIAAALYVHGGLAGWAASAMASAVVVLLFSIHAVVRDVSGIHGDAAALRVRRSTNARGSTAGEAPMRKAAADSDGEAAVAVSLPLQAMHTSPTDAAHESKSVPAYAAGYIGGGAAAEAVQWQDAVTHGAVDLEIGRAHV